MKRRFFCLILASSALRFASRSGSWHREDRKLAKLTVLPGNPCPCPYHTDGSASPHLPLQNHLLPLVNLLLFIEVGCLQFLGGGLGVGGRRGHHGSCHLRGGTLGPRGPAPSPTLTISHSLRTTLTCVRICRTWASSTESSSSFFSVGIAGTQGWEGAGRGRHHREKDFNHVVLHAAGQARPQRVISDKDQVGKS